MKLGWRPQYKRAAFATIGDGVFCAQGHRVGVVTAPLSRGQVLSVSDFHFFNTTPHSIVRDTPVHICKCEKRAAGDVFDPALKGPAPNSKTAPAATPSPAKAKQAPPARRPAVDDFKL